MILFLINLVENSSQKFNKLYKKYRNYVFVVCNNILHDIKLAEDASQESFISINNNLNKIMDLDSNRTKGYIAIIARNNAIDLYNKQNNILSLNEDIFIDTSIDIDPLNNMYYENLLILIGSLKIEYSNVLMLRYVHEMEYKEIADSLNITEENARKRVERAKSFKKALEGEIYE